MSSALHNSHNEVLMANLMVLGGGAFGGDTSLVLCEVGLRQLPAPSTLWGHSKKLEAWNPPSALLGPCWCSDLRLLASISVSSKLLSVLLYYSSWTDYNSDHKTCDSPSMKIQGQTDVWLVMMDKLGRLKKHSFKEKSLGLWWWFSVCPT